MPTTIQTTFTVANATDLNTAIRSIDVGGGNAAANTDYTITITGEIDLNTDLLVINLPSGSTLTIEGTDGSGGAETINGMGDQRGFFVYAGTVALENLMIENAVAQGGSGGGSGLGGGLFVTGTSDGVGGAQVTLDNVAFSSDGQARVQQFRL